MMISWVISAPRKVAHYLIFQRRSSVQRLLSAFLTRQTWSTASEPTKLLEVIAATVRRALNPSDCVIWLRAASSGQEMCPSVWFGSKPPAFLADCHYQPCQQSRILPVPKLEDHLLRTALLEAGMSLVTPLVSQGQVFGWLGIGPPRRGQTYSTAELCFLEILAYQAATTLENLRLKARLETSVSQLRRAYQQIIQAQENERRQLAETLHDETLQHLADLSVRLGLLRLKNQFNGTDLDDLQARLAKADRYLREVVRGVHPAVLSDLGLIEAVITFLEALPHKSCNPSVQVELRVTGFREKRLPDQNLELALYRFMQNAALNALNHGQPRHIGVDLDWGPDSVEVSVEDDGCGMATTVEEAARAGHFGLLTMRERIEALGGKFASTSQPGRGTLVSGRVPLMTPSPAPGQVEHYTFELN
jgi:signal transduction histidine kinase